MSTYRDFYGLEQDPFFLTPDPRFVYLTSQHREALSGLVYSTLSRPGLTLLIGEAGTGKTTLLYTLCTLLEKRQYCVALCVNPTLTPNEFYDFLFAKIVGENAPSSKTQRLIMLEKTLRKNHAEKKSTILIIDEAHRMSLESLEEIRLLLNVETPREKLLEIILAGQVELSDLFRRQELRHLKQRVSYVCKLKPLNFSELREYVHHRLNRAGRSAPPLFTETALRAIFEHSTGIPRLINTLCDNCLQIGFALQAPAITVSIVEEAARDLDLAPLSPAIQSIQSDDLDTTRKASLAPNRPSGLVPNQRNQPDLQRPPAPAGFLEGYASRQRSLGSFWSLRRNTEASTKQLP